MSDIRLQIITVDDNNEPDTNNNPYEIPNPVNAYNCKPEEIILPGKSENVHNTYATKMMRLEQFLFYSCWLYNIVTHNRNK